MTIRDTKTESSGVLIELCVRDTRVLPDERFDQRNATVGYDQVLSLLDLFPLPGSVLVLAETEPFNVEIELSEERLVNWLSHFGINAEYGHEPVQIHASGHACGSEIQTMIDKIEPRVLVPIHTEKPELFANDSGEVVEPVEGLEIGI